MSENTPSLQAAKLIEVDSLPEKSSEIWLMKNFEALEAYKHRVEERGVFSDEVRTF